MCHLLDELRKELEEPNNKSYSKTETDSLGKIFSHLESGWREVKTKEDTDPLTHESLIGSWDLLRYDDPLLDPSPVENTPSTEADAGGTNNDDDTKGFDSAALLGDEFSNNQCDSQEGFHQIDPAATKVDENCEHSITNSDPNQGDKHFDGEVKELEDLGSHLSEMLHVSRSTHSQEPANGADTNTVVSVSDDDF